jgi:uncharacterized protein (DUF433 family)
MQLTISPERPPLSYSQGGMIRVGNTRVTLDTVIGAFKDGSTAEEIVSQYPALTLSDTYSVIAYYLQHQVDVDSYLRQNEVEAEQIRAQIEARFDPAGIRERLLARQRNKTAFS